MEVLPILGGYYFTRSDLQKTRHACRHGARLADVREDPVELIQAVVAHHQLSAAPAGLLDGDAGAPFLRHPPVPGPGVAAKFGAPGRTSTPLSTTPRHTPHA